MPPIGVVNKLLVDLKPAAYNPRKIDPEMMKRLKRGLQEFGCVDPLIVTGPPNTSRLSISHHAS